MEEISLPPSSSLHVFEENTHPECPGISKFPPINNLHQPQVCIPPQTIHLPNTTSSPHSEDTPKCAECNNDTSGAHRCPGCIRCIHVFCGRSNGKEGFGAGIWCTMCDLHRLQGESEVERVGIKRLQSKLYSEQRE